MIGWHCNKRLTSLSENKQEFVKGCKSCGRTFVQRKRQRKVVKN